MKTASERKRDERQRKREAGLVLKQVWMPPNLWPVVQDLATAESEAFVFSRSYTTKTPEDHTTAHIYETAREIWTEIGIRAGVHDMDAKEASEFGRKVLRAMLKTIPDDPRPHQSLIDFAKKETFG